MQYSTAFSSVVLETPRWLRTHLPGITLVLLISLLAYGTQLIEEHFAGHALIEALVIALIFGVLWRNMFGLGPAAVPGVSFAAKPVLEMAIVLLGASIDLPALVQAGPGLLLGVVGLVVLGIASSFAIGRLLGLNRKLALLVAAGNSICGNSAIAAVAPVIDATADDIASSIALTAVLGVVVVLLLPLLIPLLHFSFYQYGVLAGMTVYAVPQVLAATFPVSAISGNIGTLVKLVRVLMLGPVVLVLSLSRGRANGVQVPLSRLVPWFIIGFVLFAAVRSIGLLPVTAADGLREASRWLTVAAMAALGLEVNIAAVKRVGPRVVLAVLGSLAVLLMVAVTLIHVLGITG